ncbi:MULTISPECIES: hypothetical protein [unclassified Pseudomonas]|uniref:hypothetical protein n=1 Tax=unclassified Pseudomonas TaxID=196821 RepID=UPI000F573D27|nr:MULTISPECIES: hypothetical protein [unclassified Pseudomonas]AZF19493.1 hypothetical protein C4J91_0719 [Pseudomonas sp. R3-52-08]AZF24923.1 hypothetical protein C4J90_0728 [Pseudomonas sp. R2-60-08W]AZF30225.1 hypothetical protein C4J89_0728 [Pseudomonas sp. R4-35-07]
MGPVNNSSPQYGYYNAQNPTGSGASGAGQAEDNFEKGEQINDYTTKKQLEAKLISGINQAAKGFQ